MRPIDHKEIEFAFRTRFEDIDSSPSTNAFALCANAKGEDLSVMSEHAPSNKPLFNDADFICSGNHATA